MNQKKGGRTLVDLYDSKNNFIRKVFFRYALQRVINGGAVWIKNRTAIKLILPAAITKIFSKIGEMHSIGNVMARLVALFPNDPFAQQKAAGAPGGASRSGFIELKPNGMWQRVR